MVDLVQDDHRVVNMPTIRITQGLTGFRPSNQKLVVTQTSKASTIGTGFEAKTSPYSKANLLGTFEEKSYNQTATNRHKSINMVYHNIFQKLQSPNEKTLNGTS